MSSTIGKGVPLINARAKVTGEARYTDDYRFPRMLNVRFLRSPHAHARITNLDTAAALTCQGVVAIATGKDLPTPFGVLPISKDEPAMAIDKVRYIGEIVAAVAAESAAEADAGVAAIKVTFSELDAVVNPTDALEVADDSSLIHEHGKDGTNIHKIAELSFNDPEKALEKSAVRRKTKFSFPGVTHGFTEPHATIAHYNDDETLTVISATQVPHYLHRTLSEVLGLPLHRINVKKPTLGGGFGGKSDPFPHEIITAYLALKSRRPVSCRFTREEVFLTNHGRHPTEIEVDIGADADGKITGLVADTVIDGGAYASFGVVTSYYNGVLLQGPYRIDPLGFRTRRVYTNKPQSGAMRGHGGVNPRYAVEVSLDMLAKDLNIDPCDIRQMNFLGENTETSGQLRITSNGVADCLAAVREKSGWNKRHGNLPAGHGLGVACGFFISGSALPILRTRYPDAVVHTKLDFDGRIVVFSGASDIGQGSDTMLAQITAEVLGVSMDHIQVESADTRLTPVDLGSYSSRVTFMVGNAAKDSAEKLRDQIAGMVANELGVDPTSLSFSGGMITSESMSRSISWDEAVEIALSVDGSIVTSGSYKSPKMGGDFKGAGAGLSPAYSFGAFISEVEVDPVTGTVEVVKVWGAHDCGRALNPLAVEGQIEGCIHMGLGQVVSEEMKYRDGRLLNASFLDYRIPTTMDTPEMDITIIESEDKEGPFGAKEAGEGPIHPVLPSIGNAVYDAVGVRILNLPITPDKMLTALAAKALQV